MSHISTGCVLRFPDGKFIRTYGQGGSRFVQITPDIECATIVRDNPDGELVRRMARATYGNILQEVRVRVVRQVQMIS